jgi:hypothetical protein
MPKATLPGGPLVEIANAQGKSDCWLQIPPRPKIYFRVLPEISDQKGADYSDESVIGRSSPLKTYSSSQNRSIGMQIHFVVSHPDDVNINLDHLRWIESAVYPRTGNLAGAPYVPPPVCQIKCGTLLADFPLCVVLKSYSVKFPTEVAWDSTTFCPFKFDVDTNWDVVYRTSRLPGQERILASPGGA